MAPRLSHTLSSLTPALLSTSGSGSLPPGLQAAPGDGPFPAHAALTVMP
jgi:hypothetical protein